MFCTNCGAELPANAANCPACEHAVSTPPTRPISLARAKILLTLSICSAIACCLPFGVAAIVYSSIALARVSTDPTGAAESARTAKMWLWIAIMFGLLVNGFYVAMSVLAYLEEYG